jgi:hypothetical protein
MEQEYLIWSIEHTAWWAPAELGYIEDLQRAGRYTKVQAARIVRQANRVDFNECMIPVACLGLVPVLSRIVDAT